MRKMQRQDWIDRALVLIAVFDLDKAPRNPRGQVELELTLRQARDSDAVR